MTVQNEGFNVALWKNMVPDFIIVFIFLLLCFALIYIWGQRSKLKSINKKLVLNEALYRSVFEQAPIGIAIMENKKHVIPKEFGDLSINPTYEKILGRNKEELKNVTWDEITFKEDLPADIEKFEQFNKGDISGYTMEKRFIKPDETLVWTNMKISNLLGIDQENKMHVCLLEDISEQKKLELELKKIELRATMLISNLPGLAYRCNYDDQWTMQFVSEGCYKLTGYTPDSLVNNRDLSYNDLITLKYRDSLRNEWEHILAKRLQFKYEYEITTASGEQKWVLEMGQGIYNEEGEVEALEGLILDISDKKEYENKLRFMSEHDIWTGLYNREYLENILENDAKMYNNLKRALISINLSTVQLLTANYGFHYTQVLIKKAAEALSKYCTDKRMLFQTYENRFVFYLKDYKDKCELIDFCETISETLRTLFVMDRIGGGIGIVEIEQDDSINIDELLRNLLIASDSSIHVFEKDFKACFYDEAMKVIINRESEIIEELSRIASDDTSKELFLQYQPILDLTTDSISGFEALARLRTDNLGLVSPVEFIPIAEKTKLIIPIGEKIFIDAFRFLNRLKEDGYETMTVSINVSAIQIFRPDFISNLFEIINKMQVNPRNIGIEITETIFSNDFEEINNTINKLRKSGIQVAIDDFGTGYSSLAREKELKVDCLKIDKFFIDRLLVDGLDKAITSDIISIAHKMGHCAVAEGIEDLRQLKYLKEHGCDRIQGYLISKPLDEEVALEFLEKHNYNSRRHSNDD